MTRKLRGNHPKGSLSDLIIRRLFPAHACLTKEQCLTRRCAQELALSILPPAHLLLTAIPQSFNPYAAGGGFGQYKMMQKNSKITETLTNGSSFGVLSESYPMNTNMTGFRWVSKIF